jgi:hypothetical protein
MRVVEEPSEPPPQQLSLEQQLVMRRVQSGENVFFTGPAGEFRPLKCSPSISLKGDA